MWIENISEYDTCHCVLHQHPGQSHCCLLAGSLPQPLLLDLDFVTVLSARKSGVVQLKQKSCHVSSNFTFYWLRGPEYFPGPARPLLPCARCSLCPSCSGLAAPSARHDTLASPGFLRTFLPMPVTLFFIYLLGFVCLLTSKSLPRLSERSSSTTLFVLPTSWCSLSPLQLNFSPKYLPSSNVLSGLLICLHITCFYWLESEDSVYIPHWCSQCLEECIVTSSQ